MKKGIENIVDNEWKLLLESPGLEMKYFTSGGEWTWGGSEVVAEQTRYWEDPEDLMDDT